MRRCQRIFRIVRARAREALSRATNWQIPLLCFLLPIMYSLPLASSLATDELDSLTKQYYFLDEVVLSEASSERVVLHFLSRWKGRLWIIHGGASTTTTAETQPSASFFLWSGSRKKIKKIQIFFGELIGGEKNIFGAFLWLPGFAVVELVRSLGNDHAIYGYETQAFAFFRTVFLPLQSF